MDHAWTQTTGPPSIGNTGTTTLLEGSTFCISTHSGDVHTRQTAGLFVRDIRVLAEWVLEVDSAPVEALTVGVQGLERTTFPAPRLLRNVMLALAGMGDRTRAERVHAALPSQLQ